MAAAKLLVMNFSSGPAFRTMVFPFTWLSGSSDVMVTVTIVLRPVVAQSCPPQGLEIPPMFVKGRSSPGWTLTLTCTLVASKSGAVGCGATEIIVTGAGAVAGVDAGVETVFDGTVLGGSWLLLGGTWPLVGGTWPLVGGTWPLVGGTCVTGFMEAFDTLRLFPAMNTLLEALDTLMLFFAVNALVAFEGTVTFVTFVIVSVFTIVSVLYIVLVGPDFTVSVDVVVLIVAGEGAEATLTVGVGGSVPI